MYDVETLINGLSIFFLKESIYFPVYINEVRPTTSSHFVDYLTDNVNCLKNANFVATSFHLLQIKLMISKVAFDYVMHQSIETTAPRGPGHSGEFNIYPVLKDGLFPRPKGQ